MKTKQELEQLTDEQEMLDFFTERNKDDLELSKMKMFHGFQKYCKKLQEAYTSKTKDMTPEEKKEYEMDLEGDGDDDWEDICNKALGEVISEYYNRFDIEHDDMDIVLHSYTKYFSIDLHATVYDSDKKFSDFEFEVELNDEAHFLIDLSTAIFYNHCSEVKQ